MFRSLRRWTPTLAIALGIGYFAGHALTGESGLIAWAGDKSRLAMLEAELADARAIRVQLEDRAGRLREDSLDLDYLDERSRALLGMGQPGDIVVPAASLDRSGRASRRPRFCADLDCTRSGRSAVDDAGAGP
jgi:cell division protein FtsB